MKKALGLTLTSLLVSQTPMTAAADSWGEKLSQAVKSGTVALDLRYRFEGVDQDGFDDDAEASLLRSRLSFTSGKIDGFHVHIEADNVTSIGSSDYNSTENGKTRYPVVADPEGTEINQAYIGYSGARELDVRAGRQRILHGNQRFVGGVGWRQNEQTYDGLRIQASPAEGLTLDASYIYNINRIFGPNDGANPADWEGDSVLLRADYVINEAHTVSAFGYFIDVEGQGGFAAGRTVNNANSTYGVEYTGTFDWLALQAAYAQQTEAGDSELDYNSHYYQLEAAATLEGFQLKAGYEVLAADNGVGFKTPLATLHKFQGWADKFLSTPGDGIEDAYVALSGKAGPVTLMAVYHDFQAESSSDDFGSEIDLVATWPVSKQFTLQAKLASFDSDDSERFDDTDKFWLIAQLKL